MTTETISLEYKNQKGATLTIYVPEKIEDHPTENRPMVLIIPGGGYSYVSPREGECVALRFMTAGYNAAVLNYSVEENARFPRPLCEAALAMAYLRENAEKYGINPDRIFICGFSAGGHLALSLGVFWNQPWLSSKIGKESDLLRPTAQILCYPVVTATEGITHPGTAQRALGGEDTPERRELISLEKQVSKDTPPTFLWTTATDAAVPCENSLLLVSALQKEKIPLEFHMYGWGRHGLSLANSITETRKFLGKPLKESQVNPHIATWFPLLEEWLEENFIK